MAEKGQQVYEMFQCADLVQHLETAWVPGLLRSYVHKEGSSHWASLVVPNASPPRRALP